LATAGPTGSTPAQIRQAYGFNSITFNNGTVAGDGSGTTIAIVDAYNDPNIANDLHQFDLQFGLPDPVLTKVNQTGGTTYPPANSGWITEIALDVEWAHAIAPKANILLVEATNNSFDNLLTAVNYASNAPGVVAVSMSWGGGEFFGENRYDSYFTTPSGHGGVTFVASSGDSGAPVGYPAISPNVLSVGGTTLAVNIQGRYLSESGWSGSGGGISGYESQPAYQNGVVTQSAFYRTNPDVAYDADPNTGFPVYDSYNNSASAPWDQWGGTSDAAPQWAALIAIADQGRALAGEAPLDGATQTLPMLYTMSAGNFHDVTSGSSVGGPNYPATPGYDLVTGRGSPVANLVVNSLIGTVSAATVADTPGLYNPANSVFYLRSSNSGGYADAAVAYGSADATPSLVPLVGNWTGSGVETIGLYDPTTSTFYLKDSNSTGYANAVFTYDPSSTTASWIPLVGDWTGSGVTTIGLYDPATSTFYLRNSNSSGSADTVFTYGAPGAGLVPIAGDWTGSGVTTVGLYDPATSTFYLKDSNSGGYADSVFVYGPADTSPTWTPVVGDWNGSGVSTVGLYNPTTSTFYLKDSNSGGYANSVFVYGPPNASPSWVPLAGNWGLTVNQAQAAVAAAHVALLPTPSSVHATLDAVVGQSLVLSREFVDGHYSRATASDVAAMFDEPKAASDGRPQLSSAPTSDGLHLGAALYGDVVPRAITDAIRFSDSASTDDSIDLLASAIDGQSPTGPMRSLLSDAVMAQVR